MNNPEIYEREEDDEEAEQDYLAFEREYEDDRSWEALQEDEHGNLRPLDTTDEQLARRRRLLTNAQSARIRRGMIRYVQLVVDLSRAASINDMRPVRSAVMSNVVQRFIRAFFDENPLSQLGIIIMRNGVAERLTELSSSPEHHIQKLRQNLDTGGDVSLQNALDLATDTLSTIPPYGYREVLILLAALSSCDPGDVMQSVKTARKQKIRVSVVGLSAEVFVCKRMSQDTGGQYGVALNEAHMEQLMLEHATPPPAPPGSGGASLVRMGFPNKGPDTNATACFVGLDCALRAGAYACPRCKARTAELPSECHVCGLSLVSSPHLARSYHHLFPVKAFSEVTDEQIIAASGRDVVMNEADGGMLEGGNKACYGCLKPLEINQRDAKASLMIFQCPDCKRLYCFDCDVYIHEQLHNCPGCEGLPVEV